MDTRRSVTRLGLAVAGVVAAGLLAFGITSVTARLDPSRVTPVKAPRASAQAPSPQPLADVGRADLPSVVTVAVDRMNEEALGTGWLFDSQGDFVTNAHVVQGHLAIRITDRQDRTHVVVVLGMDQAADIALLRSSDGFTGTPLPVDAGTVGEPPLDVVALASSRSTGQADMTLETIIAVHQDVPLAASEAQPGAPSLYRDMLDLHGARVYQGNSGGPVLDQAGRVVGIITLASPSSQDSYAIPVSRVLAELRRFATQPG